ncbi:MAG: T9SS type A sorting domain-containing protein [Paludibacter sp.]
MKTGLLKPVALALLLGSAGLVQQIAAQSYLTGDFHQHTTYTDGSYTIGHMMSKNNQYGLQWWANSEHGGGFTTNARVTGKDNNNTIEYWDGYTPNPIIGTSKMSGGHQVMWRWQMLRDSSFTEILKARLLYPAKTILQSYEMNVPGHEHGSMGLIANQFSATPNCSPIAQFEFMFDNSDTDLTGGVAQGWTKSTLSGHDKTLEALTWLKTNYPTTSYLVPAHPERKQPSSGYTIASFRDMNNTAPDVCFGFESMPGHQKDPGRGGYSSTAQGGGTYGGTGYFSAIVGGLWDAMLSEGRHFWLFANSDCHYEAGDFYPGEYQKNYTYTNGKTAQNIVDGLRSGNTWVVEGDLIDSLIYNIETIDQARTKAVMGSDLVVNSGKSVKITIKARDPQGSNYNTYSSYTNPVLDHIDLIKGKITGKIDPSSPNYTVDNVSTTSVIARFDAVGGIADTKNITSQKWTNLGNGWVEMSLIIPNVTDSVYFRLRGSNLGLNVTNETDADGNPLADALMGANDAAKAFADLWFYSNPIFVYTTPVKTAKFQIKQASDDLEEALAPESGFTQTLPVGQIDWNSSDLELGCEGSGNSGPQMIGLRFPGINLSKNKTINNAYIEMEVDVATSKVDPCNLIIRSEDSDNPATFTNTVSVLTARPKSSNSVAWNVDANSLNVVDQRYYSANIASLVQANLNREGWSSGNAMAFYITGSGRREMESFDGEASAAAALVVEYEMNEQEIREMQIADSIAYKIALKADSILATTSSLVESSYTIPSWTNYLMAKKAVSTNPTETVVNNFENAVNGLVSFEKPYSISMTFNVDPTSRIGFAWYNNAGVTDGKVEIVNGIVTDVNAFNAPLSINATSTALTNVNYNVSGNNLSTLAGIAANSKRNYVSNKALVTGLMPNTTYSYRVGKPGAWSEIGTFTTAKASKDAFSFIYVTDPQANTVDMFDISQRTTHVANTMYPNVNFWLSCGDLIETSGSTNSEWEYEQFFKTQQDIFMNKQFAPVIGNHDKSANKNFSNHFNTFCPAFDATSTTPGSIYSFVYGDALFMALSYEDYSVPGRLTEIADWMRAQVAANPDTKWRIAFYHKTMYTGSSSHQSDTDGKAVRDALAPVFDELHIDLALQGHDHIYEVMGPIKNKTLVNNAVKNTISVTFDARTNLTAKMGGIFNTLDGTMYFLNNSAGKKKYEPRSEAQMASVETGLGLSNYFGMFSGRFGQNGLPTFSNISVSTDTIAISTYEVNDEGVANLFDSFKIVKTNDFATGLNNTFTNGQHSINIYPVPVKDFAYITFKENVDALVEVYATNGTLLKSESVNGSAQVDLSNLSKGNYLMKVSSETGNYAVKFIKE